MRNKVLISPSKKRKINLTWNNSKKTLRDLDKVGERAIITNNRPIILACFLKYIWLRKKRDTQAAYAFLKRLVKQFDEPKVVVTDKAPSITSAFKKLKEYGFYQGTEHRTIKYLNNLIEQDHRPVKRRNKFYRSLRTASTTIKGMEAIRGLYKK